MTLAELEAAEAIVREAIPPSPQIRWPLLCERAGCDVWVKHENHLPTGAFKIRGGLVYVRELTRTASVAGLIAATRGNHGQSVAFAARRAGLRAVVVHPHGNSPEKNAAMRALGAECLERGHDFQSAHDEAQRIAAAEGLHFVRSFHPWLVRGVATCGLELLRAVPDLDTVYVPIGLGSGICGMIAARDALGLTTRVVGVVAEQAPAYARSFAAGRPIATESADTMADGVACRVPDAEALAAILRGAERVVTVSEAEIRAAIRHLLTDAHQLAEGAGAAALAALLQDRDRIAGRRVAVVLSGANLDLATLRTIVEA